MDEYTLSLEEQEELKTLCRKYYEAHELYQEIFDDDKHAAQSVGYKRADAHIKILEYIGMEWEEWRKEVLDRGRRLNDTRDLLDIFPDWQSLYVVVENRMEWLRWSKTHKGHYSPFYGYAKGHLEESMESGKWPE